MIRHCKFKCAKAKIQKANTFENGKQIISLCEILHICKTFENRKFPGRDVWPYTLLQIPTSSTDSEVKSRYETLRAHLATVRSCHHIRGTAEAIRDLDLAMSMYNKKNNSVENRKRKADDDIAIGEENAAADGGGGGDDNPYAARSPEFNKLRKHIFTALPQQPHFSPLAKYCPSVRQEMKLGFDMIFIKLTQKLQNLGDLSQEHEDTIKGELSNLEEMGYDVMKLRERFDLLVRVKTISKNDESYQDKIKNLDGKIRGEMLHLAEVQCRISKLKSEKQVVEAQYYSFKSEMASLKSKLSKGDLCSMVKMEEVEDN